MKKVSIYILAWYEDAKRAVQLLPIFVGLLLIITAKKASQILSIQGENGHGIVGTIFITGGFCLWGFQGIIFATHNEFPVFLPPLNGRIARYLGIFWAIACFAIAIRAIFTN